MKTQIHLRSRPWILTALGIILLSAHGLVFYLVRHHLPLSATILLGVAVIVVIKHLGAFSSFVRFGSKARSKVEGHFQ